MQLVIAGGRRKELSESRIFRILKLPPAMKPRPWVLPGCLLTLLFTGGCVAKKVDQNLAKGAEDREVEFNTLLDQIETEPKKSISWDGALRRMLRDNLGLQQSQEALENAEKQSKRQWLGLIPRMSAFLSFSKGLTALGDLGSDDLNASVIGNLNIPNPFEFYGMLYGAALQAQNARWSNELDQRRAFTELYGAFLDARLLSEEMAAFELRKRTLSIADSRDVVKSLYGLSREKDGLERRLIMHRGNVNRLLNTPGGNWDLTGGLPRISFRDRYRSVRVGNDFGKMALNLYAIRIESAIMQTQRVKYQQWPSIQFGLSNPPLYTSSGNNDLSGDDFRMFSGASKSVDLTDVGGREAIQDAERRLKYTREQMKQGMEREGVRILQIQKTYGQLLAEESRLEAAVRRLDRPASSEVEIVLKDLELRSQLELQLIQTRRQVGQLDLQYLIWDERYWKS